MNLLPKPLLSETGFVQSARASAMKILTDQGEQAGQSETFQSHKDPASCQLLNSIENLAILLDCMFVDDVAW